MIGYLDYSIFFTARQQNVFWFQISMHYSLSVQVLYC